MSFEVGQYVQIPCSFGPGPFAHERVVNIEYDDEVRYGGFVDVRFLAETTPREGFLEGVVRQVETDEIVVQTPAHFFTTANGMTRYPLKWATHNLRPIKGQPLSVFQKPCDKKSFRIG